MKFSKYHEKEIASVLYQISAQCKDTLMCGTKEEIIELVASLIDEYNEKVSEKDEVEAPMSALAVVGICHLVLGIIKEQNAKIHKG